MQTYGCVEWTLSLTFSLYARYLRSAAVSPLYYTPCTTTCRPIRHLAPHLACDGLGVEQKLDARVILLSVAGLSIENGIDRVQLACLIRLRLQTHHLDELCLLLHGLLQHDGKVLELRGNIGALRC